MKVIRAGTLGFCMGVRRAVEMAMSVSDTVSATVSDTVSDEVSATVSDKASEEASVYTLGPLIHNPRVLEMLKNRGVVCLNEGEVPRNLSRDKPHDKPTVLIRAHGVSPLVEADLAQQGMTVLDATCPNVKVSQQKVRSFAERGYRLFLAGEENHAEIAGLKGYAFAGVSQDGLCLLAANPTEAEAAALELFRREPGAKTVLIGQTTIRAEEYFSIGEKIRQYFPSLEIVNSICGATRERQEALRELCGKVDAVLVAGGSGSANTRRLLSLALELGKPAWLVQAPEDIPPEISAYKTVGLSAGASTPDGLIDEIENALKAKENNQNNTLRRERRQIENPEGICLRSSPTT